jgi:VanZ family protein
MAPVGPITDPGRREHRLDLALWSIVALSIASTVVLSFVEPPGAGLGHGIDKVQHALAYFVTMLTALLAAVWRPGRGPGPFPGARWLIAAGALACGALIEIVQSVSTTNRQGDVRDWLAEVAGVGLALVVQLVLEQRSSAQPARS